MHESPTRHDAHPTPRRLADADAEVGDLVVVTGDRHGVVSGAGPAWTRITGIPLAETVDKPITHFLDRAGIELELVEFVAQHFVEGRRCQVEFPFDAADGRRVRIHLEVEPVRDEHGDVTGFLARARELAEPETVATGADPVDGIRADTLDARDRELARSRPFATRPFDPAALALSPLARHLRRRRHRLSDKIRLEARLGADRIGSRRTVASRSPATEDRGQLEPTLARLLDTLIEVAARAIGEDWGVITVSTGETRPGRAHVSIAHPIPKHLPALANRGYAFLEVHDTSDGCDDRTAHPVDRSDARDSAVSLRRRAAQIAASLGGTLHVSTEPGCGTQALVLFPLP
ncbi:MAG: PAS domain-containing protein [Spirochaetaceae bacterium]|nr:PAS domain-containing protein [Myxococcales bacterium]MCB9724988.1 PAS domain-containing protein [Spirochaetaceae bacterium]HPG26761.1 PAS domain-containing protein [Myxococcota bacterium]